MKNLWKLRCLLGLVSIFLVSATHSIAQIAKTNQQVVIELLIEEMGEQIPQGSRYECTTNLPDELESGLFSYLMGRKDTLTQENASLRYFLSFTGAWKIDQTSSLIRRFKGNLRFKEIQENRVIRDESIPLMYESTLQPKDVERVNGYLPSTMFEDLPLSKKQRFRNKVLLPLLILSSVGMTTYLLFTVRS